MTYLGRLFNLSAHSSLRDSQRSANHSSLRRPSSRASVRCASSEKKVAQASRSCPPDSTNQPPTLKPSLPSGSWTTPSSETFCGPLITIRPISVLLFVSVLSFCLTKHPRRGELSDEFAARTVLPSRRWPRDGEDEGGVRGSCGDREHAPFRSSGRRRRVPRADRPIPPRAARALLPDPGLGSGRGGHGPGDPAGGLART